MKPITPPTCPKCGHIWSYTGTIQDDTEIGYCTNESCEYYPKW